jgi:hypothetical protein
MHASNWTFRNVEVESNFEIHAGTGPALKVPPDTDLQLTGKKGQQKQLIQPERLCARLIPSS